MTPPRGMRRRAPETLSHTEVGDVGCYILKDPKAGPQIRIIAPSGALWITPGEALKLRDKLTRVLREHRKNS